MVLEERYAAVRRTTEQLCEPLSAEDCMLQSMPDASPAKWHLGHTAWFFETIVLEAEQPDFKPFRSGFRELFNSYYNTLGEQHARPERGVLSRPSLDEVRAYRRHVDTAVLQLLDGGASEAARRLVELGLHHEQQHQELILTDLKHAFSRNPLRPAYRDRRPPPAHDPGVLEWRGFESGVREIGHGPDGFAFDNERPRHRVFVEAFEIASRPVSNGEFLEFVSDGGYERPDLWLSDGWTLVRERGWSAPLYWERGEGGWYALTLAGLLPVRREDPVCHVSHFEADAFARWAGARLPTESEWECAAAGVPIEGNLLESGLLHPAPSRPSRGGLAAVFGDVWEWTGSAYTPYPGFRPLSGALGEYNGKFMSGQLVLRGGSCATPASHLRTSYRNFFYPDARWQFSGIRLARDAGGATG